MSSVYTHAESVRDKHGREMPRLFEVTFVHCNVLQLAVFRAHSAAAASRQIRRHFAGADIFEVIAS